ncbi:cysteine protease StiP family protein [Leucothrix arctica]|uniref:Uncharacterized protein n=1 Tax=Leucothrix arctica TaxID=1481894 RepID=A0A317CJ25_9GAMM|nr:cysteine protease StiP family protein [Leucothrix arctica]PWQ98565.1 hypothetical protein DKT75_03685 [Leucothrix arctica]
MKTTDLTFITGSYTEQDCRFLLQPIQLTMLSVEEKERQLQSGKKHYSEMVSQEAAPSRAYLDVFYALVEQYRHRLAQEIADLAYQVNQLKGGQVTVVSLARAGTPIGVLLTRALRHYYGSEVEHYSVSIVRDKGIDEAALEYIEAAGRPAESIIFADGWTAKGVITHELKTAVAHWNAHHDYQIPDDLCVVSDIGGTADIVATTEDYVIPSGILNSTVSGLISRSILLAQYHGFHQCVMYTELQEHDLSNWFVDEVSGLFKQCQPRQIQVAQVSAEQRRAVMLEYIEGLMAKYDVKDRNRIKPGIAEATRVMLRRIPRLLIVRDLKDENVNHLVLLAKDKGVKVLEDARMPFNAVSLIADAI